MPFQSPISTFIVCLKMKITRKKRKYSGQFSYKIMQDVRFGQDPEKASCEIFLVLARFFKYLLKTHHFQEKGKRML
jgi:hypothetical protein